MADKTLTPENVENNCGEIRIANDVISIIAGMALSEIPGIYLDGRLPEAFLDKSNAKNVTRAIKIEVNEGLVAIGIIISMEYGKNVAELCVDVQDKVKAAVQTMTGLSVSKVDVTVTDLIFKKDVKGDQRR